MLDNQRGALAGGQLNPSLGPDATPMGHLFKQLAIFLLMTTLGLGALTQVIWDSYLIWPPTVWFPLPAENGMSLFIDLLGDTFTHMLLYAAPFIAVLLLLEFGIALLGSTVSNCRSVRWRHRSKASRVSVFCCSTLRCCRT